MSLFENYALNTYCIIGTTTIIISTLLYGIKPNYLRNSIETKMLSSKLRKISFTKVNNEIVG